MAAAPEGVGGSGEREGDGGGERERARGAWRADEPVQCTRDRQKAGGRGARPQCSPQDYCGAEGAARCGDALERGHAAARWRRRSGSRSSSERGDEEPGREAARTARCESSSARVATRGPVPRSWARAESEAGTKLTWPPHGAASAATSRRVLSRKARSPLRAIGIATSRTHPRPNARSVAAGVPSTHRATTCPAAASTVGTKVDTTIASPRSPPLAITAPELSARVRARQPLESSEAGHRTSAAPRVAHDVSAPLGAPRSSRTRRVRLIQTRVRARQNASDCAHGIVEGRATHIDADGRATGVDAREWHEPHAPGPRCANRPGRRVAFSLGQRRNEYELH